MMPGTLPYKTDVLVETKYDSEYLHGTRFIIDNAHPGNVNFNKILSTHSVGYQGLSSTLQAQLTCDIVKWVGQNMGRFLTQNEEGNWAAMSLPAAQKVIHKALKKTVNPIVDKVLTELAFLLSETKFGVLRDMAIHRKHIPDLLQSLQDKILNPLPAFVSSKSPHKNAMTTVATGAIQL